MSIIRGALVTIITILLFISLFSTAVFLTISMSLDYEVIKPEIYTIVNDIILNQSDITEQIDESLGVMQIYCENNSVFVQENEDYTFEFPCEIVNQGTSAIITHAIESMIEEHYYKEYDCEFKECFSQEENMFFVFSKHSQDYWTCWFYLGLMISIGLVVLLFFFMESKSSLPFLLGILLIVISLPFLGMGKLLILLLGWEYSQIFAAFFTQTYTLFLIFLILGVVSIGIGIVLKFLAVGRFFGKVLKSEEKVSKKDIRESVKEVIKEEKVKPKKISKK